MLKYNVRLESKVTYFITHLIVSGTHVVCGSKPAQAVNPRDPRKCAAAALGCGFLLFNNCVQDLPQSPR